MTSNERLINTEVSFDGLFTALGYDDGLVRIWIRVEEATVTYAPHKDLIAHKGGVSSLSFSYDN